jgi:hypothetical protein
MFRLILACILTLSPLASGEGNASWIGPASSASNQWIRFRKTFEVSEIPAQARAVIAADSQYWLWLNGTLIVRAGGLKRGPSPDSTYYDVLDLAHRLAELFHISRLHTAYQRTEDDLREWQRD